MTINLSTISYRPYQQSEDDDPVGWLPAHGSPTSLVSLKEIKYRAYQLFPEDTDLSSVRTSLPPYNDDFANARLLNPKGQTITFQSTRNATFEVGEEVLGGGNVPIEDQGVWYKIVATERGQYDFTISNPIENGEDNTYAEANLNWSRSPYILMTDVSDFSYANNIGGAGFIAVPNPTHQETTASQFVEIGEIIYYKVYSPHFDAAQFGFNDQTINFDVTVTFTAIPAGTPPANDDIANAELISGSSGSVSGDNTYATVEDADEEDWYVYGMPTVWYKWQNTTGSSVDFLVVNLQAADFQSEVEFYTTSLSSPTFLDLEDGWQDYAGSAIDGNKSVAIAYDVAPGDWVYINSSNWNYEAADFGPFTFDWNVGVAIEPSEASAIASISSPTVISVINKTITSVYASATASVTASTIRISVTAVASATASVSTPVVKISVTGVAANATASVIAPVRGTGNITVTSTIAISTASVSAPTITKTGNKTITSVVATSTASVSTVIATISVTAIATSTAAIAVPIVKISVTSIGVATASVIAPTLTGSTGSGGSDGTIGEGALGE